MRIIKVFLEDPLASIAALIFLAHGFVSRQLDRVL